MLRLWRQLLLMAFTVSITNKSQGSHNDESRDQDFSYHGDWVLHSLVLEPTPFNRAGDKSGSFLHGTQEHRVQRTVLHLLFDQRFNRESEVLLLFGRQTCKVTIIRNEKLDHPNGDDRIESIPFGQLGNGFR